ncbi:MAG: YciI family protein [Acidobacteriota bacterium]
MFLVLIRYLTATGEIERARPAHRAFLDEHYRAGTLVCSGPRTDGTGGIVLARGTDRSRVEELFRRDPYAIQGLAVHDIVEFDVKSHAPAFAPFLEPLRPEGGA